MTTISIFLTLAALCGWANHRWSRLPPAIGMMVWSLCISMLVVLGDHAGLSVGRPVHDLLSGVDFKTTVLEGMLSFLLFAGALHVDLSALARQKKVVALLATAGVILSTLLVGLGLFYIQPLFGLALPLIACLLFGALISPTDPVAVLSILKSAGAPHSLETKITGESLFNDGVGLVVFLVLAGLLAGGEPSLSGAAELFFREVVGGVGFGLVLGWAGYRVLKNIDDYTVEILVTLAMVAGGWALANSLHLSGPLAMVVTGLFIGNHGRAFAMSPRTRARLDEFWELLDEILNAVLFVWMGLELTELVLSRGPVLAGLAAIPLVLAARYIAVGGIILTLRRFRQFSPNAIKIITWAGLRGGISLALAMSLPAGEIRDILLPATYIVVVFSILVQGLTLKKVVQGV